MRVDMTPILVGKTDRLSFSFEWDGGQELFPDLIFEGPVRITGEVVNRSGYMLLSLNAETEYTTECARCLEKLKRKLSFGLEKSVVLKADAKEEDDDAVVITDSAIDLTEAAEELMFLEIPSRDLCKEDCLGFCTKCGKNLNNGSCGCNHKEIDPRLAVLKKFLDGE